MNNDDSDISMAVDDDNAEQRLQRNAPARALGALVRRYVCSSKVVFVLILRRYLGSIGAYE